MPVHGGKILARALKNAIGEVDQLVGVSSDITERKTSDLERERRVDHAGAGDGEPRAQDEGNSEHSIETLHGGSFRDVTARASCKIQNAKFKMSNASTLNTFCILHFESVYGSANTNIWLPLPGLSSGVSVITLPATSEGPVLTATYCLPSTANVIG